MSELANNIGEQAALHVALRLIHSTFDVGDFKLFVTDARDQLRRLVRPHTGYFFLLAVMSRSRFTGLYSSVPLWILAHIFKTSK